MHPKEQHVNKLRKKRLLGYQSSHSKYFVEVFFYCVEIVIFFYWFFLSLIKTLGGNEKMFSLICALVLILFSYDIS